MREYNVGDTYDTIDHFYGPNGSMWYDFTPKIPKKLLYCVTGAKEAGRPFDIYSCSEFDVDYHIRLHGLGWYSPGTRFNNKDEVW